MLKRSLSRLCAAAALVSSVAVAQVGAASAETKGNPTIAMFSGGLTDPFFGAIKKGADDAAKALGVDYQYVTITDRTDVMGNYIRLLEQTVSRKPDVLVVANFFPSGMDPILKRATAEGMPVIAFNAGQSTWKSDGALLYIGENPAELGRAGGEQMGKLGVKHAVCFNHVPGNPTQEQRCQGFADGLKAAGGSARMVTIPAEQAQNMQAVLQAMKGILNSDRDIDGIITVGAAQAVQAARAVDEVEGRSVKVGSVGISQQVLEMVGTGKISFVLDLEPYIQGYYSILAAAQYAKFKVIPTGEITTGPLVINRENVGDVREINRLYTGVRGAL